MSNSTKYCQVNLRWTLKLIGILLRFISLILFRLYLMLFSLNPDLNILAKKGVKIWLIFQEKNL